MLDLKLKFTDNQNQKIVDAILKGLKSYLEERKRKKEEMLVSTGYAWTKSNHIDTALGQELEPLGIKYDIKRIAGWEYLQFSIANEKILFLVKSPSFIGEFQKRGQKGKRHYIREYAKSNDSLIKTEDFQDRIIAKQLQLPLDEIPEIMEGEIEGVDKSYIIVYSVDFSGMVESIKSYLTNSIGKIYEVDDLTNYIEQSPYAFTQEEAAEAVNIFKNDQSLATDNTFEFEVIGELTISKDKGSA